VTYSQCISTCAIAEAKTTTIIDSNAVSEEEEGKNELLHQLFINSCTSSAIMSRVFHANRMFLPIITYYFLLTCKVGKILCGALRTYVCGFSFSDDFIIILILVSVILELRVCDSYNK